MVIELKARRLADDFIFLEGLKWHDGQVWASDVFDNCVYAISPEGSRRKVCDVPTRPSGLGFLPDGTLIIASAKDRRLLRLDGDRTSQYADLSNHAPAYVNDFVVDAKGRIFVGDFGYDIDAGEPPKPTCLLRVDPDGAISEAAAGVEFPNGAAIINQGRTLVLAETWVGRLTAFDLNDRGELSNRRLFADMGGRQPDGICADAEGAIWAGCFNTGEFVRVEDGGNFTHRLKFDGSGITCTLGGANGSQLFLSTYLGPPEDIGTGLRKGNLFVVDVDVPAIGAI